jgi:pyruvate-formate lyase-activating enzyme
VPTGPYYFCRPATHASTWWHTCQLQLTELRKLALKQQTFFVWFTQSSHSRCRTCHNYCIWIRAGRTSHSGRVHSHTTRLFRRTEKRTGRAGLECASNASIAEQALVIAQQVLHKAVLQ